MGGAEHRDIKWVCVFHKTLFISPHLNKRKPSRILLMQDGFLFDIYQPTDEEFNNPLGNY